MLLIVLGHHWAQIHKIAQTMQSLRCNLICYYLLWGNGWLGMVGFHWPLQCSRKALSDSQVPPSCFKIQLISEWPKAFIKSVDIQQIIRFFSWMQNDATLRIVSWLVGTCFNHGSLLYYNILWHSTWMFFNHYTSFCRLQCSWPLYMVGH